MSDGCKHVAILAQVCCPAIVFNFFFSHPPPWVRSGSPIPISKYKVVKVEVLFACVYVFLYVYRYLEDRPHLKEKVTS